MRGVHTS
jgi:hypothetical protein